MTHPNGCFPGDHHPVALTISRRRFLRLTAAAASGVALYSSLVPGVLHAGGHTEAMLLSCMDYRLINQIEHYMFKRCMRTKYDHVILAGASLGALNDKFPAWGQTFWDHLDVAKKLHDIRSVIIMDHRDCGAYKVILGEDLAKDAQKETAVHKAQLEKLAAAVKKKYPELGIELLLMGLDGEVETL
ncbi:MAG: twin-arginine translocation signal domain-containing protein [Magnetococcales bacterium]|nr:twin-arginine translocation signal domain-containing protein [Magnetococcales bacterium]